jgi:hypothetical protein
MHLYLDLTKKEREEVHKTLVNSGLYYYTGLKDFLKGIPLLPHILFVFLKNFITFLPLSVEMCDCSGKVVLKNGKTRNVLSLIYLEIYLVVDVMHGIKKVKF